MTTLREVGEFGLINRLATSLPNSPILAEGIGDDCAVVRVGDELLAVTCDMLVEDVHFRLDPNHMEALGWKTSAVSLSDIAAMGGHPLFATISVGAPADTKVALLERFYAGLAECLNAFGAVLAGGDTVRSESALVFDLTMAGRVPNGYTTRRGAKPGDLVVVTGMPGCSAAGLQLLEAGVQTGPLVEVHRRPQPRVAEGQWLNEVATAMIDISDGLVQDAAHIAAASGVRLDLDANLIPIAPDLAEFCDSIDSDPHGLALAGGEDYELLFTMPDAPEILQAFQDAFEVPLTVIGVCAEGDGEVRVNGEYLEHAGFNHFGPL